MKTAPRSQTLIVVSPCHVILGLSQVSETQYYVGVASNWDMDSVKLSERELEFAYDWAAAEGFGQLICGQWHCPEEVKLLLESIE